MATRNIFKLIIPLGSLLLILSCSLPQAASPTPTPDLILTTVAKTVAVLATKTSVIEQSVPSATVVISLTPSLVPPSETPTVTNTVTPAVSLTPTPSGDPKSWLGNPTRRDTLDNGKGFGLVTPYTDENSKFEVTNGALIMNSYGSNGWRTWRVRPPELVNVYLEGTFKVVTCAGADQFGLVFRSPNYESGFGYYFSLTCDGRYTYSRQDDTGTSTLINPTASSNILAGQGQTNRLGIMAKDNSMTLYINGHKEQEINDSKFSKGFFGVFAGGSSGNLVIQLDEIESWDNPK